MSMEEANRIALQQQDLGVQLNKLLANAKKDSLSRRTPTSYESKLKTLEEYWAKIESNHAKMVSFGMSHNYFDQKYYEQLKIVYEEVSQFLKEAPMDAEQRLKNVPPKLIIPSNIQQPGGSDSRSASPNNMTDPQQKMRIHRQELKMKSLKSLAQQINDEIEQQKSKFRYETLYKKLCKHWDTIYEFNKEIEKYEQKFIDAYFTNNAFEEMEAIFEETEELLQVKLSEMENSANKPNIPLPKIEIPTFSGSYENWQAFYDLFERVVGKNTTISAIEKMQYLKTNLKGEASRLIQNLVISEENYQSALDILEERYNNKRLVCSKLLNNIIKFPSIQKESANELKKLHDSVNDCLPALKNMGVDTSTWDPIIIQIIINKWDSETNKLYEQSLQNPNKIQQLTDVMRFLRQRFQTLESMPVKTKATFATKPNYSGIKKCPNCSQDHDIFNCKDFIKLTPSNRLSLMKQKGLCLNCLKHSSQEVCLSPSRCRECQRQHHSLLHLPKKSHTNNQSTSGNRVSRPVERSNPSTHHIKEDEPMALLATALVEAQAANGEMKLLRVLIDSGSQVSLVTEKVAQMLNQPRQKVDAKFGGVGHNPCISKTKTRIQISPRFSSNYKMDIEPLVITTITQPLPQKSFSINKEKWENTILADPQFNETGPIDILLGASDIAKFTVEGMKKIDGLIGQKTEFGWILYGQPTNLPPSQQLKVLTLSTHQSEDQQLTKFWEIENVDNKRPLSQEDKECEELYEATIQRDVNGSYTVKVPFKNNISKLGTSRSRAFCRLLQLEKKLRKDKNLKEEYDKFMDEYIELGHMIKVDDNNTESENYYIPHQAVIRESSSTTKVRVVFDASCKTSTNISLNEAMYIGPRLQQELIDIVLRWRRYKIVFTADIEKMYRQIKISPEDQKFHRILWRKNTNKPVEEYWLTTVTYGTAAAPYLAVRTLHQLARDEANDLPNASKIVLTDFYVDDLLSGSNSEEEAIQIQKELIELLSRGQFNLRKWSSNSQQVLQHLPEDLQDKSSIELVKDETKKSLGIHWAPLEDTFKFKVSNNSNETKKLTKRYILSEVAKIFDPLGLLAPVTIKAKLLIQELWLQDLQWDSVLSDELQKQWHNFQSQLKSLEEISIPRWIQTHSSMEIELHGFCDASEKAYGAAIYCRTIGSNSKITLVTAKSKVAPARQKATLPRLELCTAVLLAKLMEKTVAALDMKATIFAWSDSMITLAWIKGDVNRWKTFVANRVSDITRIIPAERWNHVRSEDNPADIISRGINPSEINLNKMWFNGPSWLTEPKNWPSQPQINEPTEEIKTILQATVYEESTNLDISRFSTITKLVRVMAYCKRVAKICRKEKPSGPLTAKEIFDARLMVVKIVQQVEFQKEINAIQAGKKVDGKIASLSPFLDKDGILRVGGRLQNANMKYTTKHPAILHNNHLAKLIIRDAHSTTLHGGNQLTLANVRQQFWIVNGKKAVQTIIRNCVKCQRYRAEIGRQQMGNLPEARVNPSPPFTHTGVDYAGPISIRTSKGRGNRSYKGYVALFVCFATKAVHMEIVSDLSADAFLAAFKRFIARRGSCAHLYSDNGTNFVGASKTLVDEIQTEMKKPEFADAITTIGTQWHFNPPAAPHFGGLWEAGVKSMKHHLKRVVGEAPLTFEELTTLICQIEACLNSRPLCPLSNDADDFSILTPGHFLIGRSIISPPDPIDTPINRSLTSRWRSLNKMKKDFWQSWSSEYLHRLQQRHKWKQPIENVKIGDLVLLKEEIHPSKWPMARITDVHPAPDGKIRVVTLQRSKGSPLKRAIQYIVPLSYDKDELSSDKEISTATNDKKTVKVQPINSKTCTLSTAIMLILCLFNSVNATVNQTMNYGIHHAPPGFYIEHVGFAKIERGTFRIELQYNRSKLEDDAKNINYTIDKVSALCLNAKELSDTISCSELINHLREQRKQFEWIHESLNNTLFRSKRGLFGKMLTSVFGVNDEVYSDIDALDKNQKELIRASNHQTKFMLTALSTFNDTEKRINTQLQHFQAKLNEGIQAINEMSHWYSKIDQNKLSIHVLASFQVASNFINEINFHYSNMLDIHYNRGKIYRLQSPAHLNQIIQKAQEKLPSNMKILSQPLLKTDVKINDKCFSVLGYFPMVEVSEFTLMKVTPVPLKITDKAYWILDIPNDIIAVDYNTQLYFQIPDNDLKEGIMTANNEYLYSPTSVQKIDDEPNCVIDEIYQRTDQTTCHLIQVPMSTIVWKELYMPNTWMYITSKVVRIALMCNGDREDIALNQTGIIQISQECVIKTKHSILTPKRSSTIKVISSFSKHLPHIADNVKVIPSKTIKKEEEAVISVDNKLRSMQNEQSMFQEELGNTFWHNVKQHTTMSSSVTIIIVFGILAVLYAAKKMWIRRRKKRTTPEVQEVELVPLRPLRRDV